MEDLYAKDVSSTGKGLTDAQLENLEVSRARLNGVLNPGVMTAEHHLTNDPDFLHKHKDYPRVGWQDTETTHTRWQGFQLYKQVFKIVPEQNHELWFLMRVPKDVKKRTLVSKLSRVALPLMLLWHGGGLCCGSADYNPWDAQHVADLAREANAIVVSFNYRLLPYVDGASLLADIDDALHYISNDLGDFLQSKRPDVEIDCNAVMTTGESAGGFLAAYSWLTSPLPLKAVYLRYPMLVQYSQKPEGYGGIPIKKDKFDELALTVLSEIERIRKASDPMPVESSLYPPTGMRASSILSSTDNWRRVFNHSDILELLKAKKDRPSSSPHIFISHGTADSHCPIVNSERFAEIVVQRWPDVKVYTEWVPEKGHALDYELNPDSDGCEWLRRLVDGIKSAWLG